MSNNAQLIIPRPSVGIFPPEQFEVPPVVKRGAEIVGSLALGALGGYICYWITRLVARLGMLEETGIIHPLPYILGGVAGAAILETARLTYDLALYIIGDREKYENLTNFDEATAFDRLRHRTWKVVGRVERLQRDIDIIFSRLFNIRTAEQIRNNYASERDYYLSDPKFMEIARQAFFEQIYETFTTAIPQELGIYCIEALGYTILGGHLFIWLHGVTFLSGLIDKVGKVHHKIRVVEEEEYKKRLRERENKKICDVLAMLYPAEFARLEAEENDLNSDRIDSTTSSNDEALSSINDNDQALEEEWVEIVLDRLPDDLVLVTT